MKKKVVDYVDLQIINILQKNANITNKELSERIGISPPPTLVRVQNLWKRKILSHYQAKVDPSFFKYNHTMIVIVSIHTSHKDLFISNVKKQKEVIYCANIKDKSIGTSLKYYLIFKTKSKDDFEECLHSLLKDAQGINVDYSEIEEIIKDEPLTYTSEDIFS